MLTRNLKQQSVSTLTLIIFLFSIIFTVDTWAVTETSPIPGCRWPRIALLQNRVNPKFTWGSNILIYDTLGLWQGSTLTSVSDWNSAVGNKVVYGQSSSGYNVLVNTYSANDGYSGYATPTCSGSTTTFYNVLYNVYYGNKTTNKRRAVTGHELGHSISVGHVGGSSIVALLGYNPDPEIYYIPRQPDKDLINQVYP